MNTKLVDEDSHLETLKDLLADVLRLREEVVQAAAKRMERFKPYYRWNRLSNSARNLAHYLALRQHDLRPLQDRLAQVGLSSLGRGESHVLANLDRIIEILSRAVAASDKAAPASLSQPAFTEGYLILKQRTNELLGPTSEERSANIMVTLPSEAAWDYELIHALINQGMDCARINCAHDDRTAWQAMIDNVRRAATASGKSCRILMDLAGHKIRTGPIQSAPAVKHLKVHRDAYGQICQPTSVLLLTNERDEREEIQLPKDIDYRLAIPETFHTRLQPGDRLTFSDTRGKPRYFEIVDRTAPDRWLAHSHKSTYLAADTLFEWQRSSESGDYRTLETFSLCPFPGPSVTIRLYVGDVLLLTRDSSPGQPARYDDRGRIIAPARISCTYTGIIDDLKPGAPVWIDDGKLGTVVESIDAEGALLRVTQAGPKGVRIRSDKGLNLPETRLNLPPLSDKDLADLDFVCQQADLVGFSFVETLEDMEFLMAALAERGASHLPIIAKIETNRAFKALPDLILGTMGRHALGIMIARGDLAVELGSVRMAEIQEEILWVCEAAHIPVIWATQVLETLAKKGVVSRPEITDAAMSVRAECVMLNKGPYVLDAVRVLSNILSRMQAHQRKKIARLRALHW